MSDSESDGGVQGIVIDNGSGSIKAGFSADDGPRVMFPTVVGYPKSKSAGMDPKDCFVGDEAQAKRGMLNLKNPIERGKVTNWDDMEKIWHHTFYSELRVDPKEHPVLLTEIPQNKGCQNTMLEIMFEKFDVPAAYVAQPEVLALYASGATSGMVVTCGEGVTRAVPINEGFAVQQDIVQCDVAGCDITNYLVELLNEKKEIFTTSAERLMVKEIKEKVGYVAQDYDQELKSFSPKAYELPDGTSLTVKKERFQCAEALFQPTLVGKETKGIHQVTQRSLNKFPGEMREHMCANVVLSGGTSMLPGFQQRFEKELKALFPGDMKIEVVAPEERKYATFIGGSILSSLSSFADQWIDYQKFKESGILKF